MPFTIGGEWLPNEKPSPKKVSKKSSGRPVKVRLEKRKRALLTVILNLTQDSDTLNLWIRELRSHCACGGKIDQGKLELQGDHQEKVRLWLGQKGIRAQ